MPFINIRLGKPALSSDKKAQLISEVTQLVARIAGKDPSAINVIIEDIDPDNWGIAGESLTKRRGKSSKD